MSGTFRVKLLHVFFLAVVS